MADGVVRIAGVQFDLYPRVVEAELTENVIKEAVAGGDGAVHADLAVQLFRFLHQRIADHVPLQQGFTGVVTEQFALVSKGDGAVVALKQVYADFVLQLFDAA